MSPRYLPRVMAIGAAAIFVLPGCDQRSLPTDASQPQGTLGHPAVPPVQDSIITDSIPWHGVADTVVPLTGQVKFVLRPMRCGSGCYLMYLSTTYELGCYNFVIVQETRANGRHIHVDIAGVTLPGNYCQSALGPARAETWMPTLTPGRYQLHFTYGQDRDHYQIIVDDNYDVAIITKRAEFTVAVKHKRVHRRDSIWDGPCEPQPRLEPFPPENTRPLAGKVLFGFARTRCGPGVFGLRMVTDYNLRSSSYWLVHRASKRGRRIEVDIRGVHLPLGYGDRIEGPAYGKVLLPPLEPGRYQLQFTYERQRDHYQLVVDEDYDVEIVTKRATFTIAGKRRHP